MSISYYANLLIFYWLFWWS